MEERRRCLVLGATGMVGRPLCEAMAAEGWEVFGAARFSGDVTEDDLKAAGIEPVCFDVFESDPANLPDVELVFQEVWDPRHLTEAETADADEIWNLNFHAVGRVVQRYAGMADVVNGSTCSIYGSGDREPMTEADTPLPDTEYALSRIAQEELINFLLNPTGCRALHLRYMHGNDERRGLIRRIAETVAKGESLGDAPDKRVQVIGLKDFVRCTATGPKVLANPSQIINVVHPRVWTMRELAERIHQALGRGDVVFDVERGGAEQSLTADPARMIEMFGEPQEDLDDLIERVAKAVAER